MHKILPENTFKNATCKNELPKYYPNKTKWPKQVCRLIHDFDPKIQMIRGVPGGQEGVRGGLEGHRGHMGSRGIKGDIRGVQWVQRDA